MARITPVDDAWRAALPRNADAATRAYLDRLSPEAVRRSNAYFEGKYWLQLWNYLAGIAVAFALLARRLSARVRDWAGRRSRFAFVRDALFGAWFTLASSLLLVPLTVYEEFFREHQYGMATQTFGPWAAEQGVALLVNLLVSAIAVPILYAVVRRAGERWWAWGTVATVALLTLMVAVAPVWIDPLFNKYEPVADTRVRDEVLAMAHANEVPVDNVYQFDASRQTTRVSANVAGLFGTAAIRLNDNLLRCSLPEIRSITGHEIGHYVLNHIPKFLLEFSLLLLACFLFARWSLGGLFARFGGRFGLAGIGDVAALPLVMAVFSTFFLLATPITNTLIRTQEAEADRFGLNLSREPHGFAEGQLKLSEYRKTEPGALEEFVFYDHPSVRNRIHDAMQWREAMGTP